MPPTASLPHTFIYGVPAANQHYWALAAAHTSPSATLQHTSDDGLPVNTCENGDLVDISIADAPSISVCNPATRLSSCPFQNVLAEQISYPRASAKTASYNTASPPKNTAVYVILTDFALMNMTSPSSDCIASHGARAGTDSHLWHPSRHYINKYDVLADMAYNLRRHV